MSEKSESASIFSFLIWGFVFIVAVLLTKILLFGNGRFKSYLSSVILVGLAFFGINSLWRFGTIGRVWLGAFSSMSLAGMAIGLMATSMFVEVAFISVFIALVLSTSLALLFKDRFAPASKHDWVESHLSIIE